MPGVRGEKKGLKGVALECWRREGVANGRNNSRAYGEEGTEAAFSVRLSFFVGLCRAKWCKGGSKHKSCETEIEKVEILNACRGMRWKFCITSVVGWEES